MKTVKRFLAVVAIALTTVTGMTAQEEASSSWSAGLDLTSTYVWRGTAFSGVSFQPYLEYSVGNFAIGAWGSQGVDGISAMSDADAVLGYQEMDLYLSYGFDFGLSLGLTDYYYPGSKWGHFAADDSTGSHAFEINLGYEIKGFTISANYILNNTMNGALSDGGDMYFELGYGFENGVSAFIGAGNGWHTANDGEDTFDVVNVGASYTKEIKITDTWSLPIGGSVILNPQTEQFYIVGTISF